MHPKSKEQKISGEKVFFSSCFTLLKSNKHVFLKNSDVAERDTADSGCSAVDDYQIGPTRLIDDWTSCGAVTVAFASQRFL